MHIFYLCSIEGVVNLYVLYPMAIMNLFFYPLLPKWHHLLHCIPHIYIFTNSYPNSLFKLSQPAQDILYSF